MRSKFPNVNSLLSEASKFDRKIDESKALITEAKKDIELAAIRHDELVTKHNELLKEHRHYEEMIAKLINHNGGESIIDGVGVWSKSIIGKVCYEKCRHISSVKLPEDLREEEL